MLLRKSALSGMFWTIVQKFSTQGISFVVSIILARILLPAEFGLIALLSVFIGLGNSLINSGLSHSLIRTKDPDQNDFSTIFYFNLIVSLLMYGLMYFSAPLISSFYEQPLLIDIVRVYCLVFITNSFAIVQNTLLTKELDFKKQTKISIPSLIIGSGVGITMAYAGYGVWSLVWSAIVKSMVMSVQLWLWSPWRPSLHFNMEKIKYHFGFSYKLTLAGIIDTFFADIYTIVIGKFFNPIQVGFYNRANTLQQFPVRNFSSALNKVTYPLFSKIQDDEIKLKSAYRKIMLMAVFVIAPLLLIMGVLAEPMFRFLLTEKWLPAVPYFQIICFNGILYPIHAYNLNIMTVKGRSDLYLKVSLIKKILILLVIFVSFRWGIYGLLYGQVVLSIITLFFNGYYSGKLINYPIFHQIKDIFPSIILAFVTTCLLFIIDNLYLSVYMNDFTRLIVGTLLGILIYGAISFIAKFEALKELKLILLKK